MTDWGETLVLFFASLLLCPQDGWSFQRRDNVTRSQHNCRKVNQRELIIFHLGKYLEIQKLRPFGMQQKN